MRTRILLADDSPAYVQMAVSVLRDNFDLVAITNDGSSALEAIRNCKPDVAVLDLSMPQMNGLQVTREALRELPSLGVVICSVHNDIYLLEEAVEAGVRGFVHKFDLWRDLENAVKAVAAGCSWFPALSTVV